MNLKYCDFFNSNDDLNIIKEELSEGKLTSDQEKEVVALYVDQKMDLRKVAKLFNVAVETIRNILKRNIVTLRSTRKLTPEQEADVIKLYNSGMSSIDIGKKFNIHGNAIVRILKKHKINIRLSNKLTDVQEKEIINLYNTDMSSVDIGNLFNVSRQTIINILKKHNVLRRDKSLAASLSHTFNKKDYLRKYHNTRNISGQGTSRTQHFDVGASDNIGPSIVIPKRLGGHSPD